MSQAIATSRKVTLVSRTVGDLASQSASLTTAAMTNILNASAAVVTPYSSSKLKVTVSQVRIDSNGNATIDWSVTRGGTAHGTGSGVTVPAALKVNDTYLIWTEAEYNYEPQIGYALTGPIALRDQMYMRPRISTRVNYPAPS
jgi:Flp pilus assembly protein TadG